MISNRFCPACGLSLATLLLAACFGASATAQDGATSALPLNSDATTRAATPVAEGVPPVVQKINAANTKVEMTVNGSRILSMDRPIPRAQVTNPEMLDFTVLSENQVQIHAKKAGITTVNLWDDKKEIHTVDVIVQGDVRELDRLLRTQFPTASIKLFPTSTSTLILFGYVDRPDSVNRIMRIAEDYYPKVLNNMTVGGSQQVLLHVRVLEVSRTKLRNLGVDFMNFSGNDFVGSTVGSIITKANPTTSIFRTGAAMTTTGRETIQLGIVNDPSGFVAMIEALKRDDLVKVLAEPDLVTVSGRPAYYQVGGEVPYPMPTGFGNISIAFRAFGTQIDFVPIVLGNGGVRLEVKPRVSEIDPTLSVQVAGTAVPGFRTREVDTGVELKFGQTLAIAGLLFQRTEASRAGIPYLMDVPYLGTLFRRNSSKINEVELLIVVRPELVEAMDCDQVPPCGPGMSTMSPTDCDLYFKGFMEVPTKPFNMGPGGGPVGPNGPMNSGPIAPERGAPLPPPSSNPATPPAKRPEAEEIPSASRPAGSGVPTVVVSDGSGGTRVGNRLPPTTGAPSARRTSPDPYNPSSRQTRSAGPQTNPNSSPPGFIGPVGYDVKE